MKQIARRKRFYGKFSLKKVQKLMMKKEV